ncbi:alpha/beta fold hydrolase, partial [Streptomyces sp. NPDC000851]
MSRLLHVSSGPYAPPVPARELIVTSADGSRLHVEVHGPEQAPPVVLVHGWTCSTAFWAAQIRALAADHRVIAYDQRGHGRSPASPACSTEALADDLEAVLAATLAPGERAVIAGHSMGGMTVMAASAPMCAAAVDRWRRASRSWSAVTPWSRAVSRMSS